MAETKNPRVKAETPKTKTQKANNDYIEIRLPRFTKYRVPLPIVLLLVIGSFALGVLIPRFLSGTYVTITDAPSAFAHYARLAHLDVNKFNDCFTKGKYEKNIQADLTAGDAAGVNATPTFFVNGEQLVGALPLDVFKAFIDHELTGESIPEDKMAYVATESAKQQVALGHLPPLGKNKKVTVVEFSDFQCPFCERFFSSAYPQLKREYIDTGKITFIYRHYPLTSIHPNAQPSALASECANEQGKFWEYHDLLFKNQNVWSNLPMSAPSS